MNRKDRKFKNLENILITTDNPVLDGEEYPYGIERLIERWYNKDCGEYELKVVGVTVIRRWNI
jgi:hypothetical protein